jgi:hypothetical protein
MSEPIAFLGYRQSDPGNTVPFANLSRFFLAGSLLFSSVGFGFRGLLLHRFFCGRFFRGLLLLENLIPARDEFFGGSGVNGVPCHDLLLASISLNNLRSRTDTLKHTKLNEDRKREGETQRRNISILDWNSRDRLITLSLSDSDQIVWLGDRILHEGVVG